MLYQSRRLKKYCKFHEKECLFTQYSTTCCLKRTQKREERLRNMKYPPQKKCKACNIIKPASEFGYNYTGKCGLKPRCKNCCKKGDYDKKETWHGIVKMQINRANRAWKRQNPITYNDILSLLEDQNYKCNHCHHNLECSFGTLKKPNGWNASLDRINGDIDGYGKDNAQWLCISCNYGKNRMDNEEHKNKFFIRDKKIEEITKENGCLTNENQNLRDENRVLLEMLKKND